MDGKIDVQHTKPSELYVTALYAINTVEVSFNVNGIGETPPTQTVMLGGQVVKPNITEKYPSSHLKLYNWYKGSTDSEANIYDFKNSKALNNMTLIAKWKEYYEVTLHGNGGTPDEQKIDVYYNEPYGEFSITPPSGKALLGWFIDNDDEKGINENSIVTIRENHDIYARWMNIGSIRVIYKAALGNWFSNVHEWNDLNNDFTVKEARYLNAIPYTRPAVYYADDYYAGKLGDEYELELGIDYTQHKTLLGGVDGITLKPAAVKENKDIVVYYKYGRIK